MRGDKKHRIGFSVCLVCGRTMEQNPNGEYYCPNCQSTEGEV